jgi:HK97 family phage major capsid protein
MDERTRLAHYRSLLAERGIPEIRGGDGTDEKTEADTPEKIKEEFDGRFEKLEKAIAEKKEAAESAKGEESEKLSKALDELTDQVKTLSDERDERLEKAINADMRVRVTSLEEELEKARKPQGEFALGVPVTGESDASYGAEGERSFYGDARSWLADHDSSAKERWEGALGKAMTEGTGSAGGFLVPPAVSSELLALRQQDAVLRNLFSSVSVNTTDLRIASVESGLVAGWVAELAEKPKADLTFAEIGVQTFTAAGMAVTSNQLLRDATHSIDTLVNQDLARRLRAVEEVAFINGSGTNQPLGILNTAGVGDTVYDDASPTVLELLDAVQDSITSIYTDFFAPPDAIVMHPATWGKIVKARESGTPSTYIVGSPGGSSFGRRPGDSIPGYGSGPVPRGELFGLPVYCTANTPRNLGTGSDESTIIVGAFKEGLILDHESIRLDSSPHVYFTSNQTIFRAEEQVGFTAARYPRAFNVVHGTGLKQSALG